MADDGAGEKTEDPTPKRKEEAREKGQVAKSQELGGAFVLMGGFLVLYLMFANLMNYLQNFTKTAFDVRTMPEFDIPGIYNLMVESFMHLISMVAPIMIASAAIGAVINFVQVGPLITGEPLKPKLSNINPVEGMKKLFSLKSVVELFKSLAKLAIIVILSYIPLKNNWDEIVNISRRGLTPGVLFFGNLIFKIALRIALFLIIVGLADFFYQKWEHKKNLKMSKYEVKQERKEREGDPQIKQKRKEKQREMSMNRMMKEMEDADVVITNPTHIAVALKYDLEEMEAPVVLAKGEGYVAKRIKDRAKELEIEIVENKPLARSLNEMTEIGDEIPVDLYQAVAEILAFVFKNDKRY
ncbi:MAG: flagellar biosynthesis protein FlhB [Bacillota bacterium]